MSQSNIAMRNIASIIESISVWNIFPRGPFGSVTTIPPFKGTRIVRINMRYTDDQMRIFAIKSLIRLSVSGVWYSGERIVEKSTNIPIQRTVPKKVLYIRVSPINAIIIIATSIQKNTYTSSDVIESAEAICAMMDSNWAM